jgi:hypothetical protein
MGVVGGTGGGVEKTETAAAQNATSDTRKAMLAKVNNLPVSKGPLLLSVCSDTALL